MFVDGFLHCLVLLEVEVVHQVPGHNVPPGGRSVREREEGS